MIAAPRALLLPLVAAAVLLSCGGDGEGPAPDQGRPSATADETIPVIHLRIDWAEENAADLPTLIRSTGTVFVGEVSELQGQRPEALTTSGRSTIPVTSFGVTVERSLLGDLADGSAVVVEQVGGVETRADGTQVRLVADLDEPLQVGQTYLFFATVKESGALSAGPFARFSVQPDGELVPLPDWADLPAVAQLSGLDIEEAIHEIDAAASN